MKKALLFDLDGTLLPMPSQEEFVKLYFGLLVKMKDYDSQRVIAAVWKGTKAMVKNDGKNTNETVFWQVFEDDLKDLLNEDIKEIKKTYNGFYEREFNGAKAATYANPLARKLIDELQKKDIRLILATNPIFPYVAVKTRLEWVNLKCEDFELMTTYENMGHCKPNPEYYQDILKMTGLKANEVLMIGNDIKEDIEPTSMLGIDSLLIKDTAIGNIDEVKVPVLSFAELFDHIDHYL